MCCLFQSGQGGGNPPYNEEPWPLSLPTTDIICRWYRRTALVVWPQSRRFDLRCTGGLKQAAEGLLQAVRQVGALMLNVSIAAKLGAS